MKSSITAALMAAATLSTPALAAPASVSFEHKDWQVVCDNTLTCRAAGYSPEEDASGSVLITRKAGPQTPVTVQVVLADMDGSEPPSPPKLALWINGKSLGALTPGDNDTWRLTDAQAAQMIAAVKGSGKVVFKGGSKPFVLSGDGASAALLKVDDVQGRIGTPGALSKKGNKPETSVTAAIPAPVIQAAPVSKEGAHALSAADAKKVTPQLLTALGKDDDCGRLANPEEEVIKGENDLTLTPLDAKHGLISALCWRGAYNEGYGYWVVDNALKEKPHFVTSSGTDYSDGAITLAQRGRGIGDCWASAEWVWDGEAFRQSSEGTTGLCRGIRAGGAWELPEFVAEVKAAK
ncbi:DUF1176 domain-containing protein [Kosakonia cowanii]|uniref:DUF1176 domain-containing protein n=1 Tax=Kosakonia cowanii TaxID=208223 RepID=UPI00406348FA